MLFAGCRAKKFTGVGGGDVSTGVRVIVRVIGQDPLSFCLSSLSVPLSFFHLSFSLSSFRLPLFFFLCLCVFVLSISLFLPLILLVSFLFYLSPLRCLFLFPSLLSSFDFFFFFFFILFSRSLSLYISYFLLSLSGSLSLLLSSFFLFLSIFSYRYFSLSCIYLFSLVLLSVPSVVPICSRYLIVYFVDTWLVGGPV